MCYSGKVESCQLCSTAVQVESAGTSMFRFLTHYSRDPDEVRRGTLFNIFLFSASIPVIGLLGINSYATLTKANPDSPLFLVLDLAAVGSMVALWFLHRLHPRLARHVFLVFLALATINIFEANVLDRVLVVLTIPVLMAAFLIQPVSSFIYAIIVTLAYVASFFRSAVWGGEQGESLINAFNYISVMSYFALALVAWVVSRSLDQALTSVRERARELRALNQELDQRVQMRTQELAAALEREHTAALRNRTILESIGDGVLVTSGDNQIIVSNPAANRLAQRHVQNLPLEEALADVEADILDQIKDYMGQTAEEGRPNIQFEWNRRTLAVNIAPIALDLPGHAHISGGHVMVLRDVTREAELDRMKTIFLGSVSHELRTPMTAIKGYVDLLLDLEATSLSVEGRQYLGIVSTNIRRLLSLANDLIDLSRIEVGEIALYREWTRLEPIVEGAVDTVRQEFEKRNLVLDLQIEPNLPTLYLDRHRITQVLLNLLSNAYKYTVDGGAMLLVHHQDGVVQMQIKDTGVGLTEEEQTHLFERFFRANNEVVQKAGGSGLGLTISKSMIELHGGTTVKSHHKVGTTFTINLPVADGHEPG
jgi:signal transduction histidine kinase